MENTQHTTAIKNRHRSGKEIKLDKMQYVLFKKIKGPSARHRLLYGELATKILVQSEIGNIKCYQ